MTSLDGMSKQEVNQSPLVFMETPIQASPPPLWV